ncbi:hypothetical protein D6D20_04888 [Aureobasidium pullulans]|uniref:Uncharacterized protein n=1 Tax=Aureobasidium pullulans TaxID=5580 RepID=A0A4S8Z9R5_AURPU|nr:hypothetical protein D6D20_04888 [Aureobasidium pullulans]
MATTVDACDSLWASKSIDPESSAYTYTGRPDWRTKPLRPHAVAERITEVVHPTTITVSKSDLPPAYDDIMTHSKWTYRYKNAFIRESYSNDNKENHYGVSDDGGSEPVASFVCKGQTKVPNSDVNHQCRKVIRKLLHHRAKMGRNCHCDFQYIKTGRIERDTSRLCTWTPGKTGKSVLKQMEKHDRKCSCGAFNFSRVG